MSNINDKVCSYCGKRFEYNLVNQYGLYIDHLEIHLGHLEKERNNLSMILMNLGRSTGIPRVGENLVVLTRKKVDDFYKMHLVLNPKLAPKTLEEFINQITNTD